MTGPDAARSDTAAPRATAQIVMVHEAGLHARPSVKLTKLAKRFSARIELATDADGPWVDAKSIVRVMAAKAPHGALLHLRAEGADAAEAVAALAALVARDFDEGVPDDTGA